MIEVEVFGARTGGGGSAHRTGPRSAAGPMPSSEEVRRLCILTAGAVGATDGHMAIEFVDADRIAQLNAEHRDKPMPTDVLAFPIDGVEPAGGSDQRLGERPGGGERELGDVVICPECATDLKEAIIHGVLHLLGMDHETDEGEMLTLQRRLRQGEGP